MRIQKVVASLALAMGLASAGSTALMAQDRFNAYPDQRGHGREFTSTDRLRDAVARDRIRLNQDLRFGRRSQIAADRRELAHDQRMLDTQLRDRRY